VDSIRHRQWSVLPILTALWGLAVVIPLLNGLRSGATFFVNYGVTGPAVVVFVVAWLLVPPAAGTLVLILLGRLAPVVAGRILGVLVGVLGALAVLSLIPAARSAAPAVHVVLVLAGAVLIGWGCAKWRHSARFLSWLVVAPMISAVTFLASPEIEGVLASETGADVSVTRGRSDIPVVLLTFDELSLPWLLRSDGTINSDLFPNFASLAAESTWYPRALANAPYTNVAMPSMVSGRPIDVSRVPNAAAWPETLFSFFMDGRSRVTSVEFTTALCPTSLCGGGPPLRAGAVVRDSFKLAINNIVPARIGRHLFPDLENGWALSPDAPVPLASVTGKDLQGFADAVVSGNALIGDPISAFPLAREALGGLSDGDLAYLHVGVPHLPFMYLPDGRPYNGQLRPYAFVDGWTDLNEDPSARYSALQRALAQTITVDRMLGTLLDDLRESGRHDDAMLIVLSDHGLTFEPGAQRRAAERPRQESVADVMSVPLFVKYPGQSTGTVDARDVQLVDIVPTLIEVLAVQGTEDWDLVGRSLLAEAAPERPVQWPPFGRVREWERPDTVSRARVIADLLGERFMSGQIHAIGPYADLFGVPVGDILRTDAGRGAPTCRPTSPQWEQEARSAGRVPALAVVVVEGVESGDWIVAEVDGRVAGMAPVFRSESDALVAEVFMDRSDEASDKSSVRFHVVEGSPTSPRLRDCTS
jgi:hypothetical protein